MPVGPSHLVLRRLVCRSQRDKLSHHLVYSVPFSIGERASNSYSTSYAALNSESTTSFAGKIDPPLYQRGTRRSSAGRAAIPRPPTAVSLALASAWRQSPAKKPPGWAARVCMPPSGGRHGMRPPARPAAWFCPSAKPRPRCFRQLCPRAVAAWPSSLSRQVIRDPRLAARPAALHQTSTEYVRIEPDAVR